MEPIQFRQQCGKVKLEVAIKGNQIPIQVIDDLNGRPLFSEQHSATAEKSFAITVMVSDQRHEVFQQAALAALPA
jgi:hypothetical protein